jgi:nucleoside-diphosphate-sugar epimerase
MRERPCHRRERVLGSNICRLAANAGRRVRGLVRTDADADVLRAIGVEPAIGDITDPGSLDDAMTGIDGVIHAAAVLGGTWSSATADDFDRVNYHGSLAVLDAARRHDVSRTVVVSFIGPMRAMAGAHYPTPLIDPSRTNDELGITPTPVRAGVEKTVAWLHAQRRI